MARRIVYLRAQVSTDLIRPMVSENPAVYFDVAELSRKLSWGSPSSQSPYYLVRLYYYDGNGQKQRNKTLSLLDNCFGG